MAEDELLASSKKNPAIEGSKDIHSCMSCSTLPTAVLPSAVSMYPIGSPRTEPWGKQLAIAGARSSSSSGQSESLLVGGPLLAPLATTTAVLVHAVAQSPAKVEFPAYS